MIEAGHDAGIVALGLGGNEIGRPPHLYADAFQRARDEGFHVVAHAGEATGPETVVETLDTLGAERIGHGIAAAANPEVMKRLAGDGIPLEVSPTSNVRTGVVASLADVPLRTLRDHGVRFSINSDDPPMFGTSVTEEIALAAQLLELDRQGVASLMLDGIDQSFAPEELKERLRAEVRGHTPRA
jgi:aminodeoxyfutalosine deaminase